MGDQLPVRSYAEANRALAAAFGRFELARGHSANTVRAYREAVGEFITSLESANVLEADRAAIRRYQAEVLERGVRESTLELRTLALRAFFKFLNAAGLTGGHNPTLLLSHRKLPRRVQRVLTIAEVEKLIRAAERPVEAAMVEVLYATGVRVSEFVNLRFADVDFGERVIRVKNGKGGKDRIVLFGLPAADALRRYLDGGEREFLFETPRGVGPYSVKAIRSIISDMAARAGVGHVHPHALRRAFATHMFEGGADLRCIQELLGHARLSTTMIYVGLSSVKLKEVHDRCHPHAKEDENAAEN